MKNAFERMGRRAVSMLMVVCLMLGMVGTAFAAEFSKEDAETGFNLVVDAIKGGETIKDKVEAAKFVAAVIVANYEDVYKLAYAYVAESGYVDVAVDSLAIAEDAVKLAKDYVAGYPVDAELADTKALMLAEMDNTAETIKEVAALLDAEKFNTIDASWETILGLKDEMHAHRDTLAELGLELGLTMDPYIVKLNDAVVNYAAMVDAMADKIAAGIADCEAAYAAWVEEVGALADIIDPELGAAVRKFLTETPADTLEILKTYGEEGIAKLFADAAVAYGELTVVAANLTGVLTVYGEDIYNAVKDNDEVEALVAKIKAQLEKAEAKADELYNSTVNDALNTVYAELIGLYNELLPVVLSAIDEVDEDAADALSDALDALTEVLGITCDAAEGYLGWLASHADAMGAALLTALLDNVCELLTTACPIIDELIWALLAKIDAAILKFLPIADQWMYDWLYNNPDKVIAFFTEYGDEISALAEEFGDEIVGILGYIAYTYGDDVLDYVIENPCEALDLFVKWYEKYGYRIWPMIDVYLEALGVYDAIENQLDMLDAHILAQIAALEEALKEALKNADEAIREAIQAEIAALKEALKNSIVENTTDRYIANSDSYYVALGDSAAYGPAADLLAEELGLSKRYANLTFENATADQVLANMEAYAADIEKADLVTLGFDANVFTEFVISQLQAILNSEDPAEMAWAALVGEEAAPYVEEALAELTAKVAESDIPAELAPMVVMMVETYAYTYIAHIADYALVGEAVHAINADALLVLVGMYNPLDGVVLTLGEEKLDLGEYLDYLVCLSNVYSLGYAIYSPKTIYVDAPDVETSVVAGEQDVVNFIMDLVYNPYAMETYAPTAAGYQYIQEQIYKALNAGLLGDVNSDGKVNSKDAMLMLRWDAELIGADELNLNVGDVNGDNEVNSKDAMLVLRYDAELIDKFPAA